MSLFARLWNFIRRPTGYVGKDFQGNYFYEYASRADGRTRRVVKYKGQTDTLAVVERSRQLAVQWKAWLTHTRQHPPTLEELQGDMLRQERLRQNVALIEVRDREERLRLAAGAHQSHENGPAEQAALEAPRRHPVTNATRAGIDHNVSTSGTEVQLSRQTPAEQSVIVEHQPPRNQKQYDQDPWVPPPASDEPQSWIPRSIQRGG